MNDELTQKIRAGTERSYRDILGLPDRESRLTRPDEAYMLQHLINLAGSLKGKTILE